MYNYLLILFALFQILPQLQVEMANEIIRRKIENAKDIPLTAAEENLQCSQSLTLFYQNRLFEIAWNQNTALQLLNEIQNADEEGLNPRDYHVEKLRQLSGVHLTGQDKAEYDMLLTDAFLLYASHLFSGKVNPETIDAQWHVTRREGDPVELLNRALASGKIDKAIQSALPKHKIYSDLKNALKTYRAIGFVRQWLNIKGTSIKVAMEDERIPEIRERLFVLGDLKDRRAENEKLFDDSLLQALKNFQRRHGLQDDGEIGPLTTSELNVSIEQRIKQIEANLERWRWLPQDFGNYYLLINIADFNLSVIKHGLQVQNHKIIVGKPYRKTPVFSAQMQYLVFNPTWTVPPGIVRADVLPGARKDTAYLENKKLIVFDSNGNAVRPDNIDWNGDRAKSFIFRQPPGPDNALGVVKFMFPNKFHVYLHDTPSKELFDKSERAFSSGCIRVQDAISLAEYLLNDPGNWSREQINRIVATKISKTVQLKEQPNVHLLYWTAWVDSSRCINFRKDIYKRDEPLIEALYSTPPN